MAHKNDSGGSIYPTLLSSALKGFVRTSGGGVSSEKSVSMAGRSQSGYIPPPISQACGAEVSMVKTQPPHRQNFVSESHVAPAPFWSQTNKGLIWAEKNDSRPQSPLLPRRSMSAAGATDWGVGGVRDSYGIPERPLHRHSTSAAGAAVAVATASGKPPHGPPPPNRIPPLAPLPALARPPPQSAQPPLPVRMGKSLLTTEKSPSERSHLEKVYRYIALELLKFAIQRRRALARETLQDLRAWAVMARSLDYRESFALTTYATAREEWPPSDHDENTRPTPSPSPPPPAEGRLLPLFPRRPTKRGSPEDRAIIQQFTSIPASVPKQRPPSAPIPTPPPPPRRVAAQKRAPPVVADRVPLKRHPPPPAPRATNVTRIPSAVIRVPEKGARKMSGRTKSVSQSSVITSPIYTSPDSVSDMFREDGRRSLLSTGPQENSSLLKAVAAETLTVILHHSVARPALHDAFVTIAKSDVRAQLAREIEREKKEQRDKSTAAVCQLMLHLQKKRLQVMYTALSAWLSHGERSRALAYAIGVEQRSLIHLFSTGVPILVRRICSWAQRDAFHAFRDRLSPPPLSADEKDQPPPKERPELSPPPRREHREVQTELAAQDGKRELDVEEEEPTGPPPDAEDGLPGLLMSERVLSEPPLTPRSEATTAMPLLRAYPAAPRKDPFRQQSRPQRSAPQPAYQPPQLPRIGARNSPSSRGTRSVRRMLAAQVLQKRRGSAVDSDSEDEDYGFGATTHMTREVSHGNQRRKVDRVSPPMSNDEEERDEVQEVAGAHTSGDIEEREERERDWVTEEEEEDEEGGEGSPSAFRAVFREVVSLSKRILPPVLVARREQPAPRPPEACDSPDEEGEAEIHRVVSGEAFEVGQRDVGEECAQKAYDEEMSEPESDQICGNDKDAGGEMDGARDESLESEDGDTEAHVTPAERPSSSDVMRKVLPPARRFFAKPLPHPCPSEPPSPIWASPSATGSRMHTHRAHILDSGGNRVRSRGRSSFLNNLREKLARGANLIRRDDSEPECPRLCHFVVDFGTSSLRWRLQSVPGSDDPFSEEHKTAPPQRGRASSGSSESRPSTRLARSDSFRRFFSRRRPSLRPHESSKFGELPLDQIVAVRFNWWSLSHHHDAVNAGIDDERLRTFLVVSQQTSPRGSKRKRECMQLTCPSDELFYQWYLGLRLLSYTAPLYEGLEYSTSDYAFIRWKRGIWKARMHLRSLEATNVQDSWQL